MKLRPNYLNAEILDDNPSQASDYLDEDLMRNSDILHVTPKRNFCIKKYLSCRVSASKLQYLSRFLAVKVLHEDTGLPASLSPSAAVGTVWRTHLLNPGHYIRCCNNLGVSIIDHDPEEDNVSSR